MVVLELGPWVYYLGKSHNFDARKVGKWMYFFNDKDYIASVCKEAIEKNIVNQAKHTNDETGVACFYLNGDDIDGHKKVIQFFLSKNLIRKTQSGKLYNISFKFDNQTLDGQYGNDFKATIKLEDFVDLYTGEFKI